MLYPFILGWNYIGPRQDFSIFEPGKSAGIMIKDMHSFLMTSAGVFSGQMTAERPRVFMFAKILQLCRATMKQERSKTRGNMRKQCLKATSDGSRNQTSISAVASSYAWDTLEIPLGSKNTWPKSPSRTCRQHFGTFPAQSATLFYSAWS